MVFSKLAIDVSTDESSSAVVLVLSWLSDDDVVVPSPTADDELVLSLACDNVASPEAA